MIADHFWKIIFVLILFGVGVFYWQKRAKEAEAASTINAFAELLVVAPDARDARKEFEGNVYRAVAMIHDLIEADVGGRNDLVTKAATVNNFESGRAQQLRYSMQELLESGENAGVFDGMGGRCMARLKSGRAPEIPAGAFKGQRLVVAYKVPPIFVAEAAYSFCNVMLVPESARALSDIGITQGTVDSASALRSAGVITHATHQRINTAYRALR
jgi:hypothetical protein